MEYPEFLEGGTTVEMGAILDPSVVQVLGHEGLEDLVKIANIFTVCLNIFIDRNTKRKATWKVHGHKDSFHHMQSKLARVKQIFTAEDAAPPDLSEDLDDLYDLINYAAFMIVNLQEGR